MRIEVVTLFPALIEAGLSAGVLGRAVTTGKLAVGLENPRSHADDPHRTVDDRPFGGGPGMVLKAEPLAKALGAAKARLPAGAPMIGLAAQGAPFDQATAARLAGLPGFGLVAGRYEGIDQRVIGRADRRGTVDRRLCAVGRRVPGAHRDRRGRAAPARRARRCGIGGRGLVRRRIAGLAALHAAGSVGRAAGAAGAARRATTPRSGAGA